MSAAVAVEVPSGGFRLRKGKQKAKIDAAVATTMAVDAAVHDDAPKGQVHDLGEDELEAEMARLEELEAKAEAQERLHKPD